MVPSLTKDMRVPAASVQAKRPAVDFGVLIQRTRESTGSSAPWRRRATAGDRNVVVLGGAATDAEGVTHLTFRVERPGWMESLDVRGNLTTEFSCGGARMQLRRLEARGAAPAAATSR